MQSAEQVTEPAQKENEDSDQTAGKEGDDEKVPAQITPKPTLYVKNLNDKVKTQGKFQTHFESMFTVYYCRNENQSLFALFHIR